MLNGAADQDFALCISIPLTCQVLEHDFLFVSIGVNLWSVFLQAGEYITVAS